MALGLYRNYDGESDGKAARVLIVDSDRGATAELAQMLGELGCDVSYAFDARLALLFGRKCRAQVAFFDLGTRHVTGMQLAQAFRNESALAGCALIALSADGEKTPGFDAFLAKPVARPQLEAALRPFVPLAGSEA